MRPTPRGLAAGLAGLCLIAGPATAQLADPASLGGNGLYGGLPYSGGVLPSIGGQPRVGDLRPQLERYFRTSSLPPTAPPWVISPSLGVEVGVTDNALHVTRPRKADVFTNIIPSVSVVSDTAHIQTNLSYSPQITVYATQSSQNRISQSFNGQSLVTFVPDALFLDLRGSIAQSSLTGTTTASDRTNQNINRQNEVQTTSFSITPYAEHRFAGWGTGRVGYSFSRSLQDRVDDRFNNSFNNNFNSSNSSLGVPGYGAVGNISTQRERASFVSGENLGRFNNLTTVEAIQYSGGGSYRGAYRNQVSNELGFALTRRITLLGGLGYQDIFYNGNPTVRINEPTWNTGARYAPSPDSTITVLFGRRDGAASTSVDGQFAPTPRTRVFARYSTGITSDVEETQNLLNTTAVGPGGLLVDSTTGAPVGSTGSFGIQNGVFRVRRLSATGVLLANRDSYSLSLTNEERTTLTNTTSFLTNGTIAAGTTSTNLSATLSWQHELAPDMSSTLALSYTQSNNTSQFVNGTSGNQTTYGVTAALNKQFTQTLGGTLRYSYTDRSGGQAVTITGFNSGAYSENILLVGLRKSF